MFVKYYIRRIYLFVVELFSLYNVSPQGIATLLRFFLTIATNVLRIKNRFNVFYTLLALVFWRNLITKI